jgi:hypothetical protein
VIFPVQYLLEANGHSFFWIRVVKVVKFGVGSGPPDACLLSRIIIIIIIFDAGFPEVLNNKKK